MNKSDSYACERLNEQMKFFGAKPKRFVSVYAKKPRIRVNNRIVKKSDFDISDEQKRLAREGLEALMRNMAARGGNGRLGVAGSFISGMAMAQASQQAAMAQQLGAQQAFQAQINVIGQAGLNPLTGGFY